MSLKDRIFGQTKTGKQWGMLVQTASQGQIFIGFINLFLIAVTAYNTTLSPWLEQRGIVIPFWMFVVAIILLMGITMWALYKYALPSYYSVFNDQFYRHDNPLREDIEKLKEDNKKILEKLEELEKKIK